MYIITKKFLREIIQDTTYEMLSICRNKQNSFLNGKIWLKAIAIYLFSVIIINSVTGL